MDSFLGENEPMIDIYKSNTFSNDLNTFLYVTLQLHRKRRRATAAPCWWRRKTAKTKSKKEGGGQKQTWLRLLNLTVFYSHLRSLQCAIDKRYTLYTSATDMVGKPRETLTSPAGVSFCSVEGEYSMTFIVLIAS